MIKQKENLLSDLRVLDLTDEKGLMCGRILATLGSEVIKVEKPGGDPTRMIPPFINDIPNPEKSIYWYAFNADKKSITLNIEFPQGQDVFKKLVKTADVVIESFQPSYMERLGLDYSHLSQINPRMIMTSITPFGKTGPYSHYKGSDLVAMAMGGLMATTGDPDRPPVRLCLDHAYQVAGIHGAVGTMLAYHYRKECDEGQEVDVSMFESVVHIDYRDPISWEFEKIRATRVGDKYLRGKILTRQIWRCKDGFVDWLMYGGQTGAKDQTALTEWMDLEGMAGVLKEVIWEELDLVKLSPQRLEALETTIGNFFLKHTEQELEDGAAKRGIRLLAVRRPEELLYNRQLKERGYWAQIKHPELDSSVAYPGRFFSSSETANRMRQRAPSIGEHNSEIYRGELGLTQKEINFMKENGVI
ncbi:CaiB/BaiF CoA transferase family protein [Chloroflexota bacterium]